MFDGGGPCGGDFRTQTLAVEDVVAVVALIFRLAFGQLAAGGATVGAGPVLASLCLPPLPTTDRWP